MYKQIWCCTKQVNKKAHGMWPIDTITHGQIYNWYELECVTPLCIIHSWRQHMEADNNNNNDNVQENMMFYDGDTT